MAAPFAGPFRRIANAHRGAIRRVSPRLLAQNLTGLLWILLSLAVRHSPGIGLIRGKVLNFVQAYIQADLVRRHDRRLELRRACRSDDTRLVLAELINPSYDLRNIAGFVRPPIGPHDDGGVLTFCQGPAASGKNFEVWRRHGPTRMQAPFTR